VSRKKREGRIRAAEKTSTAAQLDQMVSGLDVAPGPSSWWARIVWFVAGKKWLLAILVVLLAGGVMFGVCRFLRHRLEVVPGQPVGEVIVGDTVILLDHVALGGGDDGGAPTSQGHRLTALDAASGKQLAVDVPDHKKCWAGGTRLWCANEYGRLVLIDPRTLETVAEADELIEAAKLAKATDRYDVSGDEVTLHLADGRGAQISPATLEVTRIESIPHTYARPSEHRCATIGRIPHGSGSLILRRGGSRDMLRSDPPPPAESPTPGGPALTFLDGGFLAASMNEPIVLSRDSFNGPQRLTRVDGISRSVWEQGVGGSCRLAQIVGDNLIVITGNPEWRAFAIDVKTGARRWSFGR